MNILVLSCDKYDDLWKPFFELKDKYWKDCPYETYISTETKECEYAKTINVNTDIWTKRIRETLKQMECEYVMIMCEDYFIRKPVNQENIDTIISLFDDNTATFNFEYGWDGNDVFCDNGWRLRKNNSSYLLSCQVGIWNRLKLIELLNKDQTAWDWELQVLDSPYKFYTNNNLDLIDYGHTHYGHIFGVFRGKWTKEAIEFLSSEGFSIDYSKRGIY